MKRILALTLLVAFCFTNTAHAQKRKKKKGKNTTTVVAKPQKKKDKNAIKDYKDVVTKDAVTDDGLFQVHRIIKTFLY